MDTHVTLRRAIAAMLAGAFTFVAVSTATGQDDGDLLRAFSGFLKTRELAIDRVPDLYPGGFARISVHARNADLGGMLVDEIWVRLIGVSLDPDALRSGRLRVLDQRGSGIHGRLRVQRLQDFFLSANTFSDLRLWIDGPYLYGEGSFPYNGAPIRIWLKGRFSVNGTKDIYLHIDNMRVNGFPLFVPIIRILEAQINPVLSQRDWPVTFTIRSLQMTRDGFILSSQADALAPCSICWSSGGTSGP